MKQSELNLNTTNEVSLEYKMYKGVKITPSFYKTLLRYGALRRFCNNAVQYSGFLGMVFDDACLAFIWVESPEGREYWRIITEHP